MLSRFLFDRFSIFSSVVVLTCSWSLPAFSAMVESNSGKITVQLALDGDPVTPGKQQARVNILDSNGKPVTDASVKLSYGKAPNEESPGMNFITRAKPIGEHYSATIDLSSEGKWDFKLNISTANGTEEKINMSVQVE